MQRKPEGSNTRRGGRLGFAACGFARADAAPDAGERAAALAQAEGATAT